MRAGDVVDERFEIERLIGAGGMGQVYRAPSAAAPPVRRAPRGCSVGSPLAIPAKIE